MAKISPIENFSYGPIGSLFQSSYDYHDQRRNIPCRTFLRPCVPFVASCAPPRQSPKDPFRSDDFHIGRTEFTVTRKFAMASSFGLCALADDQGTNMGLSLGISARDSSPWRSHDNFSTLERNHFRRKVRHGTISPRKIGSLQILHSLAGSKVCQ